MKENIFISAIVGIFLIMILSITGVIQKPVELKGYNDPTPEVNNLVGTEASPTQFAVAGNTPTTTAVMWISGASFVDLNVNHVATHTVSDLFATLYFSNDEGCQASTTDPDIAWFQQSDKTTASGVTTLEKNTKEWTETRVKGSNKLNWGLTDVNAKCLKAQFYTNSTTDDSYLWVEASVW